MTEDQIKHMVDRFLNYKLPENWKPDGGITFEKFGNKGTPHQYERFPVGTNLLDADQATAMVRYMVEGMLLQEADACRYQRLRVLGCAPAYSGHLERGEVMRFTNLDEFVDADLKTVPSRGESA